MQRGVLDMFEGVKIINKALNKIPADAVAPQFTFEVRMQQLIW